MTITTENGDTLRLWKCDEALVRLAHVVKRVVYVADDGSHWARENGIWFELENKEGQYYQYIMDGGRLAEA